MRMLQAFLSGVKPASTMPKPACMKNTRNAATSTQSVFNPWSSNWTVGPSSAAEVVPAASSTNNHVATDRQPSRQTDLLRSAITFLCLHVGPLFHRRERFALFVTNTS